MPITHHKHIKFQVVLLLEKNSDVAKKIKLLLEQLQVCIFAEIVFGDRSTLKAYLAIETEPQITAKIMKPL